MVCGRKLLQDQLHRDQVVNGCPYTLSDTSFARFSSNGCGLSRRRQAIRKSESRSRLRIKHFSEHALLIAKTYLDLDDSLFDFVNGDDSNGKMIFCPTLTWAEEGPQPRTSPIHRTSEFPRPTVQQSGRLTKITMPVPVFGATAIGNVKRYVRHHRETSLDANACPVSVHRVLVRI